MFSKKSNAHTGLHIGLELVKIGLKVAAVAAAITTVKEIRKLHETMEKQNSRHLLPFSK